MDLTKLYRKDLNNFQYWPLEPSFFEAKEKDFLKLDTGESVFDVPQDILEKLKKVRPNFYPGIYQRLLTNIEKKFDIKQENIFFGNGTLDVIETIVRTFLDPGDEAICFPPTYVMYFFFIKNARSKMITIPKEDLFTIDTNKLKEKITSQTKIIFIDNPSNPFGSVTLEKQIIEILELGKIVILDEAYFEFCNITGKHLINKYPNLIILRTFSKIMGIAGLRLGMSICHPEIQKNLVRMRTPHQVNIFAQFLAAEILENVDIDTRIKKLTEGRNFLLSELKKFNFLEVYDSQGAYIVAKTLSEKYDVEKIYKYFYDNKILIKKMDYPDIQGDFLRINVVPIEIAEKIIEGFKKL